MATNYAVAPGEFLQEWIEEEGNGITQAKLAEKLGVSRKHVNEILKGKVALTPDIALRLERVTGIPSSGWLAYEAQFREDIARLHDENELERHTDVATRQLASFLRRCGASTATMRNKIAVLKDFLSFAGFGNFQAFSTGCRAMLKTDVATLRESNAQIDEALMMAWIAAGEHTTPYLNARHLTYDQQKLIGILPELRERSTQPDDHLLQDLAKMLESVGVVYLFVEPPDSFPLHGITRWTDSGVPIIQQTGRRKKDAFLIWTLFHELGHLLNDQTPTTQINFEKSCGKQREEEKMANQFARDQLFGGNLCGYHNATYSYQIQALAKEMGHVPSVVVMEMHRRKLLDRHYCNDLLIDVPIPYAKIMVNR